MCGASRRPPGPTDSLEGPRPARPEDLPGIVALANRVFRPNGLVGEMGREFPVLLDSANASNLYIFGDGRRIVSHVGVLRQVIHTCGLDVPVACMGSVCTDTDCRGKGLAWQLVDLAIRRAREQGDVLMTISGKRTLYVSRGAESLGPEVRFKVPTSAGWTVGEFHAGPYEPADWPALRALQQNQPVRYAWDDDRTPRLLGAILEWGGRMTLARREDGRLAAALLVCVGHPMYKAQTGWGRVVQFVCEPRAIPALLAEAARVHGLVGLDWQVHATMQPDVARALAALGATGKAKLAGWTVVILNLAALVERIAPMAGRLGVELATEDGRLLVAAGGQSACIAQPSRQAEFLFRGPMTWCSRELLELPADLRTACSAALPILLPDYGLNYI